MRDQRIASVLRRRACRKRTADCTGRNTLLKHRHTSVHDSPHCDNECPPTDGRDDERVIANHHAAARSELRRQLRQQTEVDKTEVDQ